MSNRFGLTPRQTWWTGAGCVFLACCAMFATGVVQAAMISSIVTASGTDFMAGNSGLQWEISNQTMTGTPPLNCSQEIVEAGSQETFITQGAGQYASASTIDNSDLIHTQVEKQVVFKGESIYSNALLYDAVGAGAPVGGCGPLPIGTDVANATPAVAPYCAMTLITTGITGSDVKYKSLGVITAGDTVIPDSLGMQFEGTGNGIGTVDIGTVSLTGLSGTTGIVGPGSLGYKNSYHQTLTVGGEPFSINGNFQWTSFKTMFDAPANTSAA